MPGLPQAPRGKGLATGLLGAVLAFSLLSMPVSAQSETEEPAVGRKVWEPGKGEEEEFFEEEEEEETPVVRTEAAGHEVSIEFRTTDIFDAPPDPNIGPPADRLYYLGYRTNLDRTNALQIETQQFAFDAADATDSGWAMVLWERLLPTGATLLLESAGQWDERGRGGFWGAAEYVWAAGLNLDVSARVQGSSSLQAVRGWRLELEGKAALAETTALKALGWYFWDGDGAEAARLEAELAQYLGHRTGFHARLRWGSSVSGDPDAEIPEASSTVATLGLRHRLKSDTLLRGSYRLYWDSEGVSADGLSFGFEQPFRRGSFGAYYRHYWTDEGVKAGTWVLTGCWRM